MRKCHKSFSNDRGIGQMHYRQVQLIPWDGCIHSFLSDDSPVVLDRAQYSVYRHNSAQWILRYRHHLLHLMQWSIIIISKFVNLERIRRDDYKRTKKMRWLLPLYDYCCERAPLDLHRGGLLHQCCLWPLLRTQELWEHRQEDLGQRQLGYAACLLVRNLVE